jgi:AcrR family transcriptional regulator
VSEFGARNTGKQPVGRPRSREADSAILRAAVLLLSEAGFQGMTMERVAQRAGVGRATVYRRWRTRDKMISQALAGLVADFNVVETGDLRADLFALARWLVDGLLTSPAGRLLPQLAAQMISDPTFPDDYLDMWVCPWRDAVDRALRRGVDDGLVRRDANLRGVADLLTGILVLWVFLEKGQAITDARIDDILSLILDGALLPPCG